MLSLTGKSKGEESPGKSQGFWTGKSNMIYIICNQTFNFLRFNMLIIFRGVDVRIFLWSFFDLNLWDMAIHGIFNMTGLNAHVSSSKYSLLRVLLPSQCEQQFWNNFGANMFVPKWSTIRLSYFLHTFDGSKKSYTTWDDWNHGQSMKNFVSMTTICIRISEKFQRCSQHQYTQHDGYF